MGKKISIGDRFGMLTVVARIPETKRWLCKCDCGKEVEMSSATLRRNIHLVRSCGCSNEINPNFEANIDEAEEIVAWKKLFEYVKKLLGYKQGETLTRSQIYRLKGLAKGLYYANTKVKPEASYSYYVIYLAFKGSSAEIQRAIKNNKFNGDEEYKFNYALKIAESKIQTIHKRLESKQIAKDKLDSQIDEVTEWYNRPNKGQYKPKKRKEYSWAEDMW